MDYRILDNVIPKSYRDDIEELLLGNNSFPWYYVEDVTLTKDKIDKYHTKALCPAFNHVFFDDVNDNNDAWYPFIKPLAYMACSKIGLDVEHIIQARSFLQLPIAKDIPENHPHIDLQWDHWVCLYYVNDNEAPTTLYKQTRLDTRSEDMTNVSWEPLITCEPKKGRALFFDGKYYHSSSSPNQRTRCIINFDVLGNFDVTD